MLPCVYLLLIFLVALCAGARNVFIFGNNERGAVGDTTYTAVPQPLQINTISALQSTQVAFTTCGLYATFFITDDTLIYGWVNL
jgi:alpha-tubulin suppressor-like RCC1 family protein